MSKKFFSNSLLVTCHHSLRNNFTFALMAHSLSSSCISFIYSVSKYLLIPCFMLYTLLNTCDTATNVTKKTKTLVHLYGLFVYFSSRYQPVLSLNKFNCLVLTISFHFYLFYFSLPNSFQILASTLKHSIHHGVTYINIRYKFSIMPSGSLNCWNTQLRSKSRTHFQLLSLQLIITFWLQWST